MKLKTPSGLRKPLTAKQRSEIYWNAANILEDDNRWDAISNCCWALSKAIGSTNRISGIEKWFPEFELFHPAKCPEGAPWFDDLESRQTCMLLCYYMTKD